MDKQEAIRMLGGTLARGILWAAAAISTKMGVDSIDKNTGESIGLFIAALVVSAVATWWSRKKDAKLLNAPPPK